MPKRMSIRRFGLACVLASLSLAGVSTAASAQVTTSGTLSAGGTGYLDMDMATPARSCALVASTAGHAPMTLSTVAPSQARLAWVWRVPARARSAIWMVTATCGTSQVVARLRVRGVRRRKAVLAVARAIRVLQYGGSFHSADDSLLGPILGLATTWWQQTGGEILAGFQSGVAAGQCTSYAAAKRPDIIERVDLRAYARVLLAGGGRLAVDWAAKDWGENAREAGLPTGRVPEAGAVVVFQPGVYGAFADGHVAFVNAVRLDGSFTISEMHAPVVGRVSIRNFSPAAALAMVSNPGITFIYK